MGQNPNGDRRKKQPTKLQNNRRNKNKIKQTTRKQNNLRKNPQNRMDFINKMAANKPKIKRNNRNKQRLINHSVLQTDHRSLTQPNLRKSQNNQNQKIK